MARIPEYPGQGKAERLRQKEKLGPRFMFRGLEPLNRPLWRTKATGVARTLTVGSLLDAAPLCRLDQRNES